MNARKNYDADDVGRFTLTDVSVVVAATISVVVSSSYKNY